jgi:Amt family ammonium transporter
MASIFIGFIAGIVCYAAIAFLKRKFNYDDALDAFGCHGIGGIWGCIATGLFASKAINPDGANGLLYGNPKLLLTHLMAMLACICYSALMTFIILKVIGLITPIRADKEEENVGLDISLHGEKAYGDFNNYN